MNRKYILELFRQFLVKHNYLDRFVEENRKQNMIFIENPEQFISGSFTWNFNDVSRLSELNKMWIEELKQKGTIC